MFLDPTGGGYPGKNVFGEEVAAPDGKPAICQQERM